MVLLWSSVDHYSNCLWSSPVEDNDSNDLYRLILFINNIHLDINEDVLCWEGMKGSFQSSVCYYRFLQSVETPGLWDLIWRQKVPPRVKYFLWQCGHKILPTLSFFKKRVVIANALWGWCNSELEDFIIYFGNRN